MSRDSSVDFSTISILCFKCSIGQIWYSIKYSTYNIEYWIYESYIHEVGYQIGYCISITFARPLSLPGVSSWDTKWWHSAWYRNEQSSHVTYGRHLGATSGVANNIVTFNTGPIQTDKSSFCGEGKACTIELWLKMTTYDCTAINKQHGAWELYYCPKFVFRSESTDSIDCSITPGQNIWSEPYISRVPNPEIIRRRRYSWNSSRGIIQLISAISTYTCGWAWRNAIVSSRNGYPACMI